MSIGFRNFFFSPLSDAQKSNTINFLLMLTGSVSKFAACGTRDLD